MRNNEKHFTIGDDRYFIEDETLVIIGKNSWVKAKGPTGFAPDNVVQNEAEQKTTFFLGITDGYEKIKFVNCHVDEKALEAIIEDTKYNLPIEFYGCGFSKNFYEYEPTEACVFKEIKLTEISDFDIGAFLSGGKTIEKLKINRTSLKGVQKKPKTPGAIKKLTFESGEHLPIGRSGLKLIKVLAEDLIRLNFIGRRISQAVPFGKLNNLKELALIDCVVEQDVKFYSPENLKTLTSLNISGTEIGRERWEGFANNLTELSLQHITEKSSVPKRVRAIEAPLPDMKNLEALSISFATLGFVPEDNGQWMNLKGMPNLRELYMDGCKEGIGADGLAELVKCKELRVLSAAGVPITTLPELPKIEYLDLENTNITEIPKWLCEEKFKKKIKYLSLNGCKIKSIPAGLSDNLNVGENDKNERYFYTNASVNLHRLRERCKNLDDLNGKNAIRHGCYISGTVIEDRDELLLIDDEEGIGGEARKKAIKTYLGEQNDALRFANIVFIGVEDNTIPLICDLLEIPDTEDYFDKAPGFASVIRSSVTDSFLNRLVPAEKRVFASYTFLSEKREDQLIHSMFLYENSTFVICLGEWEGVSPQESAVFWKAFIESRVKKYEIIYVVLGEKDRDGNNYAYEEEAPPPEKYLFFPQKEGEACVCPLGLAYGGEYTYGEKAVEKLRSNIKDKVHSSLLCRGKFPANWRSAFIAASARLSSHSYSAHAEIVNILREHGLDEDVAKLLITYAHRIGLFATVPVITADSGKEEKLCYDGDIFRSFFYYMKETARTHVRPGRFFKLEDFYESIQDSEFRRAGRDVAGALLTLASSGGEGETGFIIKKLNDKNKYYAPYFGDFSMRAQGLKVPRYLDYLFKICAGGNGRRFEFDMTVLTPHRVSDMICRAIRAAHKENSGENVRKAGRIFILYGRDGMFLLHKKENAARFDEIYENARKKHYNTANADSAIIKDIKENMWQAAYIGFTGGTAPHIMLQVWEDEKYQPETAAGTDGETLRGGFFEFAFRMILSYDRVNTQKLERLNVYAVVEAGDATAHTHRLLYYPLPHVVNNHGANRADTYPSGLSGSPHSTEDLYENYVSHYYEKQYNSMSRIT